MAQSYEQLPLPLDQYDAMIALHARRSAASIAAFATLRNSSPQRKLIVVLTGTDLYRDIATDAAAQQSLEFATQIVVLQAQAMRDVPAAYRLKTVVIYQSSAPAMQAISKPTSVQPYTLADATLNLIVVGHLREEKDPRTMFEVVRLLAETHENIKITHLGAGLDQDLAAAASETEAMYPKHYTWLGSMAHAETLQAIANSDLLLHPSIMEGGAHVIIEAVQAGLPVIASDIAGNIGMLGTDYAGYFPVRDANTAASLLLKFKQDAAFAAALSAQCAARAHLFLPATEAANVQKLIL